MSKKNNRGGLSKREYAAKTSGGSLNYKTGKISRPAPKPKANNTSRPSTPAPLAGAGPLLPGQSRVDNSYTGDRGSNIGPWASGYGSESDYGPNGSKANIGPWANGYGSERQYGGGSSNSSNSNNSGGSGGGGWGDDNDKSGVNSKNKKDYGILSKVSKAIPDSVKNSSKNALATLINVNDYGRGARTGQTKAVSGFDIGLSEMFGVPKAALAAETGQGYDEFGISETPVTDLQTANNITPISENRIIGGGATPTNSTPFNYETAAKESASNNNNNNGSNDPFDVVNKGSQDYINSLDQERLKTDPAYAQEAQNKIDQYMQMIAANAGPNPYEGPGVNNPVGDGYSTNADGQRVQISAGGTVANGKNNINAQQRNDGGYGEQQKALKNSKKGLNSAEDDFLASIDSTYNQKQTDYISQLDAQMKDEINGMIARQSSYGTADSAQRDQAQSRIYQNYADKKAAYLRQLASDKSGAISTAQLSFAEQIAKIDQAAAEAYVKAVQYGDLQTQQQFENALSLKNSAAASSNKNTQLQQQIGNFINDEAANWVSGNQNAYARSGGREAIADKAARQFGGSRSNYINLLQPGWESQYWNNAPAKKNNMAEYAPDGSYTLGEVDQASGKKIFYDDQGNSFVNG